MGQGSGGHSAPPAKEALAALLVEPDDAYCELVEILIHRAGGAVVRVAPDDALATATAGHFTVALVDTESIVSAGPSVLRALRENPATASLPLIALSRHDTSEATVRRVMEHADYELVRPFSPRRFRAALKVVAGRTDRPRPAPEAAGDAPVGALVLSRGRLEARLGEKRIPLTPREFSLLSFLVAHAGTPFTRDELALRAWDWQPGSDSRAIDNTVRRLRRKLGEDAREPRLLLTARGVGYRLTPT